MESPEDIEKALAALVPSAISERGQRSLEDLIDSLAAGEEIPVVEEHRPAPQRRPWAAWSAGIGAAAAAVVLAFQMGPEVGERDITGGTPLPMAEIGEEKVIPLDRSEHVATAAPENWMSETNGVPHSAWRVVLVDQERVQDVETGLEVTISQSREEVRLLPVNTF